MKILNFGLKEELKGNFLGSIFETREKFFGDFQLENLILEKNLGKLEFDGW